MGDESPGETDRRHQAVDRHQRALRSVTGGASAPAPIAESLDSQLESLGNSLAFAFGLAGWFGVDFVLRDGDPWPVEINPRYTASIEIHELASGRSLLPEHRRACEAERFRRCGVCSIRSSTVPRDREVDPARPHRLVAPEINADEAEPDDLLRRPLDRRHPLARDVFQPGEPVMTLHGRGRSLAECRSRMIQLERKWMKRLGIVAGGWTTSAREFSQPAKIAAAPSIARRVIG